MGTRSRGWWLAPVALLSAGLLAGCGVPESEYNTLQAQNQQLKQELAAAKEHEGRLQGAIKYTVNSQLLFASGSWRMSERGKDIIAKLAEKLAPHQQRMLLVNGYTDNVPVGAQLKHMGVTSNLQLSQKRADAVKSYLISQGVNPSMITAHGYGAADPVASNATPEGRAKNRRVELELAPAS
jgi:chemotaxis protein MotB